MTNNNIIPPSEPTKQNFLTSPLNYLNDIAINFLIRILCNGPIPKHIGFIMDGNRRFAKKMKWQTKEGHYKGFSGLMNTLDACLKLGIKVVTVYAFSIENFKRSKDEVDALMELAKIKMIEICEKSDVLKDHGFRIRILGNLSYLPSEMKELVEKVVEATKHNDRAILNICFPYTSRDEMTNSVKIITKMIENDQIQINDIDEKLFEQYLYTDGCPPLDILIRTSGEIRLSDFLLWQCHQNCYIHFVNCYWPEFSLWNMLPIILEYQLSFENLQYKRKKIQDYLINLKRNQIR